MFNEREKWAVIAGLRALQGLRDSGVDEDWIERLQNGCQRTALDHLSMEEIDDLCDFVAETHSATVEDFDEWSEDAKWAVCHLLCFVPDKVWAEAPAGRPRIYIQIESYVVEDLQQFFQDMMDAFRGEVAKEAAEQVVEHFDLMDDAYHDAYHDAYQSAKRMLKRKLGKVFHVGWNEDHEMYYDRRE